MSFHFLPSTVKKKPRLCLSQLTEKKGREEPPPLRFETGLPDGREGGKSKSAEKKKWIPFFFLYLLFLPNFSLSLSQFLNWAGGGGGGGGVKAKDWVVKKRVANLPDLPILVAHTQKYTQPKKSFLLPGNRKVWKKKKNVYQVFFFPKAARVGIEKKKVESRK